MASVWISIFLAFFTVNCELVVVLWSQHFELYCFSSIFVVLYICVFGDAAHSTLVWFGGDTWPGCLLCMFVVIVAAIV